MHQLAGSGGAVSLARSYQPYGKLLASDGSGATSYGFTGEMTDSYIELLFLRSRYYSPRTGRFITKDTWPGIVLTPQTLDKWAYVENSPVNRVDPSGMAPMCSKGTCGPDVTSWLMQEMAKHYKYGQTIRSLRNMMINVYIQKTQDPHKPISLSEIATVSPFSDIISQFTLPGTNNPIGEYSIPSHNYVIPVVDALGILEYALYGLAVDYSNVAYITGGTGICGTGGCDSVTIVNRNDNGKLYFGKHHTLTLCGHCIDTSDIGNMMFGLGGVARGYDLGFTYLSAGSYNVLADWLPYWKFSDTQGFFMALLDNDGRGAIPGWVIGKTRSYVNQTAFCSVLNGLRWIGYNDNTDQTRQCTGCTAETVANINNLGPDPSSLLRLSNRGSTISELIEKTR